MILQLEWKAKKKTELVLECKASTFEYSEFFCICDPIHGEYFMHGTAAWEDQRELAAVTV